MDPGKGNDHRAAPGRPRRTGPLLRGVPSAEAVPFPLPGAEPVPGPEPPLEKAPIPIRVDDRERESGIAEILRRRPGFQIEIAHLPVGDYQVTADLLFERKTSLDFAVSVIDGRLFRQAERLRKGDARPFFIVEGGDLYSSDLRMAPSALLGAVVSLEVVWAIPILWSAGPEESADILAFAGRQWRRETLGLQSRPGYRPKRLRSRLLYLLGGLPLIGDAKAARLLYRFRTPRAAFAAPPEAWREVPGIGRGIARKAAQVLDSDFLALDAPLLARGGAARVGPAPDPGRKSPAAVSRRRRARGKSPPPPMAPDRSRS